MQASLLKSIRVYLGYTQDGLADEIGVSKPTLVRAEEGHISGTTERALTQFFKSEGITLYEKGFEQKDNTTQFLHGQDGMHELYKQIYRAIRTGQGDLWLYNGVSDKVADALGPAFIKEHQGIMKELTGSFLWRVVCEQGDDAFWGHKYAYYRWINKEHFNKNTLYVYGNKVAVVDFDNDISINITNNKAFTDMQRLFLETIWEAKAYDPDTQKPFRPE